MDLRQREEVFQPSDDHAWLGSAHGTDATDSITLDPALFSAVTFPNKVIPSGVTLGKVTATGLYGPYSNAAADGREVMQGHLFTTQPMDVGVAGGRVTAPLLVHGDVLRNKLPAGHGLDAAGETDVAGRIRYTG